MIKAVIFVMLVCVVVHVASAQSADDAIEAYGKALKAFDDAAQQLQRANLRAQKREVVKQALSLSSDQAHMFWPIYDHYELETIKLNDTRLALIADYVNHRSELPPEKAAGLINRVMQAQKQKYELKRAYVKDLGKVLNAKQALRLLLLENQIDVQVDAQIAAQIPL